MRPRASTAAVPHLDPAEKAAMLATAPPFQREARTKGTPQLGSGAVYQLPESELKIPPFEIERLKSGGYR